MSDKIFQVGKTVSKADIWENFQIRRNSFRSLVSEKILQIWKVVNIKESGVGKNFPSQKNSIKNLISWKNFPNWKDGITNLVPEK